MGESTSEPSRENAARRVAWTAVVGAVVFAGYHGLQHAAGPVLAGGLDDPVNRLVTLATVLLAAGLFALHQYRVLPPATVLTLGMVFEVVMAAGISMVETSAFTAAAGGVLPRGVSAVGPWIVFVGVFVPTRPAVTLGTGLLAATTWPVAWAINGARFGEIGSPAGSLLTWPLLNYLLAFLAFGASRWSGSAARGSRQVEELGSYRLVSPLGSGGMGEVWTATHQLLARSAAIKLVRPEAIAGSSARQADAFVKRFRREANAIAGLQSPHTVYLYDFGVSQDGRLYYVMELLDGISLQTLVSRFGPQPAPRVVAMLRQVCQSLDEAHGQGLIHRDLKPSNVMLCRVARTYDFIKVLDFGLTKSVAQPDETQLTVAGTTTGTPGYMAPEVVMGDAPVDGRADLYAVGCVAYLLLTGTPVFDEVNPTNLMLKHLQTTPDPPSTRTELTIPADLERIVLQCLAKQPTGRPSSARQLSDQLAACAVPVWTADAAADWWEEHLPPTSSLRASARSGPAPSTAVRGA